MRNSSLKSKLVDQYRLRNNMIASDNMPEIKIRRTTNDRKIIQYTSKQKIIPFTITTKTTSSGLRNTDKNNNYYALKQPPLLSYSTKTRNKYNFDDKSYLDKQRKEEEERELKRREEARRIDEKEREREKEDQRKKQLQDARRYKQELERIQRIKEINRRIDEENRKKQQERNLEKQREKQQQFIRQRIDRERKEKEQKKKKKRQLEREREKEKKQRQLLEKRLPEEESKRQLKIGLIGLTNIGNTCYMNSILQCLFNLPVFNDYFLKGKYQSEIRSNGRVAQNYAKILNLIKNTVSTSQNPSSLKQAVASRNYQFSGYKQQDAHEFLICLLQLMSEDLKTSYEVRMTDSEKTRNYQSKLMWEKHLANENSHVNSFFAGQLMTFVECRSCRHSLESFECFWDFELSFPETNKTYDLQQLIQNFTKKEPLEGYICQKCKGECCDRQVLFSRLPQILIIQLKRFEYKEDDKGEKLENKVRFNFQINLDKYLGREFKKEESTYNLKAIVNHSGTLDYGHYTAECKNPINSKWYYFSDTVVKDSDMNGRSEWTSDEPYVLFYSRKSL